MNSSHVIPEFPKFRLVCKQRGVLLGVLVSAHVAQPHVVAMVGQNEAFKIALESRPRRAENGGAHPSSGEASSLSSLWPKWRARAGEARPAWAPCASTSASWSCSCRQESAASSKCSRPLWAPCEFPQGSHGRLLSAP